MKQAMCISELARMLVLVEGAYKRSTNSDVHSKIWTHIVSLMENEKLRNGLAFIDQVEEKLVSNPNCLEGYPELKSLYDSHWKAINDYMNE